MTPSPRDEALAEGDAAPAQDESPFERPAIMDGYPLEKTEKEAVERYLEDADAKRASQENSKAKS
jgi:hypothetical protein